MTSLSRQPLSSATASILLRAGQGQFRGRSWGGNCPGAALNEIEAAEEEGDYLDEEVFNDSEEPSACMSTYATTMQAEELCLH